MAASDVGIDWWLFVVVALAAYVIPGPDFLIILRAATRGRRAGVAAAVGAQLGLAVHMLVAVVGLSAVLASHPEALTVLRLVGGVYLLYLGGRLLVQSWRSTPASDGTREEDGVGGFRQGLVTNLTNPKAVLFFASVLPQFVVASGPPVPVQVLALGLVDVAVGFAPWAVVIAVGAVLGDLLRRDRVRRWWDRVTGAAPGGLGGALLTRGP